MKAAILLGTALLCGCAGTHFTFDKASQVKLGMTESEVQRIMGKPYMVTAEPNNTLWVYAYGDAFGTARSVSFSFDTNGVVNAVPRIPETMRQSYGSGAAVVSPKAQ